MHFRSADPGWSHPDRKGRRRRAIHLVQARDDPITHHPGTKVPGQRAAKDKVEKDCWHDWITL